MMRHIGEYAVKGSFGPGVYLVERDGARFVAKQKSPSDPGVRALLAIDNPAFVSVEEICRSPRFLGPLASSYVIMPQIDGVELADKVTQGLPDTERMSTALTLASAIEDLHVTGYVYNDLSPRNVMMTRNGPVLLHSDACCPVKQKYLMDAIGTAGYRSPNQGIRELNHPSNDVFGIGALLYFMEFGEAPYLPNIHDEPSRYVEDRAFRTGPPKPCSNDAELARVVRRMIWPNWKDRPTISEVKQFLESRIDKSPN